MGPTKSMIHIFFMLVKKAKSYWWLKVSPYVGVGWEITMYGILLYSQYVHP